MAPHSQHHKALWQRRERVNRLLFRAHAQGRDELARSLFEELNRVDKAIELCGSRLRADEARIAFRARPRPVRTQATTRTVLTHRRTDSGRRRRSPRVTRRATARGPGREEPSEPEPPLARRGGAA